MRLVEQKIGNWNVKKLIPAKRHLVFKDRRQTDRQMEDSQKTTDVKRREQRDFCGHRFCLIAA